MAYQDFISLVHKSTKRNYVARVTEYPKAKAAEKAKTWGYDYWDGDRRWGYGGMKYDGRWSKVAKAMVDHYELKAGDKILDIGCGKGFLMYDFTQVCPGIEVFGVDISEYAKENSKDEIQNRITTGSANNLPYSDNEFDFVLSINTLHNLPCYDLFDALKEMERVGKKNKYICVESYRSEEEKANLLYWQLTCKAFCSPKEWEWWFQQTGYCGDHSFIYFE
tara:strand:- start:16834 stop:17496 length:663 start_codon:yes stop_codon:yes gene_type:complete